MKAALQLQQKFSGLMRGVKSAAAKVDAAAAAADTLPAPEERTGFFGGAAALEEYYFPGELTGGVCPRVVGQEREIAWNAAAEACDTERVHIVWSVTGDRIWYLASRSAEFASRPHTWCPFTSLLPGMADARSAPVCYVYYSDEAAVMMTVTNDTLQIHRGTSAVVRARAERMTRELGDAKVVTLDPDVIVKLTPVAWHSIALFDDRVRRLLSSLLVVSGLFFATIAFVIWFFAALGVMQQHRSYAEVQERTQAKTMELMDTVEKMRASTLREQVGRFADLNEGLMQVGGWMKFYQIKGGKVRWRALVPVSVTGDKIKEFNAKLLSTGEQGLMIGTDNDPVTKR